MDVDNQLDFEFDDVSPIDQHKKKPPQKYEKPIGLDDLLEDYYQEKIQTLEKDSKKTKVYSSDSSDDEDDWPTKRKEKELSEFVSECEKQVSSIFSLVENTRWGQKIFGNKKIQYEPFLPGAEEWPMMQIIPKDSQLRSMIGYNIDNGDSFMLELLTRDWLLSLVLSRGDCDAFTLEWAFNLMLYSSNQSIEASACKFICSIILSGNRNSQPFCAVEWVPKFAELKKALENYGYLETCEGDEDMDSEGKHEAGNGPPRNIRSWMKVVAASCQTRNSQSLFTVVEAENLVVMLSRFFLDNRLQPLNILLRESLLSAVTYFTDEEWPESCKRISSCLCHRSSECLLHMSLYHLAKIDFNCLRVVGCLSSPQARVKELKRMVSHQLLITYLGKQDSANALDIIKTLSSVNMRSKGVDFSRLYIYLLLADGWLWSNPIIHQNPLVLDGWLHFLRSCSCQISSTDWRTFAAKLRNKASYFLQNYEGLK